jgi:two-component system cell cycle sensor histidine kinase/response regulator CckA
MFTRGSTSTPQRHPPPEGGLLRRYALGLAVAWTLLVTAAAIWSARTDWRTAESYARAAAEAGYQKDILYRRWAAGHGGVYVPVSPATPPSPWLAHLPERDLTTPSGRQLTLLNPAYMTRQVHELGQRDYGQRGHITSLNPLRPANTPDEWERASLQAFASGATEAASVVAGDDGAHLRYMRAMTTETSCLKCHEVQGYRVGEVRGGISVDVPLASYHAAARSGISLDLGLHAALWLAGLAVLGLGYRSLAHGLAAHSRIHARYQDLVETSQDLIWQLDRDGRIVYLNPAWETALGRPLAELVGRPFTDFKDPADRERGEAAFRRMLAEGGTLTGQESAFLHHHGRTVLLLINAKAIRDQHGVVTGVRGTAFDITTRKALEERLRQGEKLQVVGQLAGGIAHDFNNQLAGILGYADLLTRHTADPVLRRYGERIATAAQRSADLTRKLLAFARKGNVRKVAVDLHGVVQETTALLERSLGQPIAIRQQLAAPQALVEGDPASLQSALLNLAVNARDAMPQGGTLTFATRVRDLAAGEVPELAAGAWLELSVTDTGCGMDAQVRARIFEPFFTTKGPGKGTGMGLPAVFGTVMSHGGRLLVESAPGQGSTFRILLPPLGEVPLAEETTPSGSPVLPHLRILVAEDEPVVSDLLTDLLRGDGHEVVTTLDGSQALDAFRQRDRRFDLVILDLCMPGLDGRRCLRELRALDPGVRVLVASGHTADAIAQELLAEGASGFLPKPFRRDLLRQALATALATAPRPASGS